MPCRIFWCRQDIYIIGPVNKVFYHVWLTKWLQRVLEAELFPDRIAHLFASLKLVTFRKITVVLSILINMFFVECDRKGLLLRELSYDLLSLGFRIAKNLQSVT